MADKKKMSVADILALARSGKAGAEKQAPPKVASKAKGTASSQSAKKTAAKKTAAQAKGAGAKGAVAEGAATGKAKAKPSAAVSAPRDTASILAAARKSTRPGPVSKAEAASQSKLQQDSGASSQAAKAKQKLIVPPMPARPAYVTRAMDKASVGSVDRRKGVNRGKGAGKGKGGKGKSGVDDDLRTFLAIGFIALGGVLTLWTLATVRFMFPNVLREPPSKFKVGSRDGFSAGQVQTKYKAQYGIWVVNTQYHGEQQLVALKSVCTHLGCTPNWLEAEQKFKCPCHGSGYYKDGINFEGPAPRPLERYAIQIADDGQVEIDKSRTFQEEMGEWGDPACFIPV